MLKDAETRVQRMRDAGASQARPGAAAVSTRYRAGMAQAVAPPATLDQARKAALQCRRCALCEAATQTVWGAGNPDANLMIVGEQPGDQEDLTGSPFIGPAGIVLRQAMAQAGINAEAVWLTNAVKHFKFTPRGTQRLHQSPDRSEVENCRWWLGLELAFIRPKITLALGASAAFALTNNDDAISPRRGRIETGLHDRPVLISWHPAHILRLTDPASKASAYADLTQDLRTAIAAAQI
jgi:uracil-DNA glycosylase family protein